jgi:hypothetical protein
LRNAQIILIALVLIIVAGCHPRVVPRESLREGQQLLSVDFQEGQTLQYKFISSRETQIIWDPTKAVSKSDKGVANKFTELMEMVVAYTPVEVDTYGLTTINATCKSVKVTRTRSPRGRPTGKDPVESLRGKTYTFTVGPSGKIEDYSQLDELIREIGEKAFQTDATRGRIKQPDMINDFVASQWFLWDAVASIEKPSEGVSVGQSWKSQLSVPTPMVMRKARDVTYSIAEFRHSEKGQLAIIRSSYTLAKSAPSSWPIPYSGRFKMMGPFGFLRGYRVLSLAGEGEELFNIEAGRTEQYNQKYQMEMEAALPIPIGANPRITIKQNLTMQLLE